MKMCFFGIFCVNMLLAVVEVYERDARAANERNLEGNGGYLEEAVGWEAV